MQASFHNAFPDPPHRFTPPPPGTKFDAIVVGAGGGGLSAAAKLSLHGKKVLVLERAPRIGGAWVTFNLTGDDGWSYRVDGSLHVLNAPAPANEIVETDYFKLLQETGAYEKLQWTPRRSIHRLVLDKEGKGREWTLFTDEEKLVSELESKGFSGQGGSIRALLNLTSNIVHEVDKISDIMYTNSTLTKAEEMAYLLTHCPELLKSMSQNTFDMCSKFIQNDDLRAILTSPVMYCAVPENVLAGMMFAEMAGMWFKYGMTYPVGGSGAIAHHLAGYIEEQGGHILLNANVDGIYVDKEKFSKATATGVSAEISGTQLPPTRMDFHAPAIISDINLPATMRLSGMPNWPEKFQKRVNAMNYSDSVFCVSMGLKNRSVLEKIQGDPEILLADSLDMDENFKRIHTGDMSFMDLNEYSQVDPDCCGPKSVNRGAVALVLPVPMSVWATDPTEREQQKQIFAEKMIERANGYLPGFNETIDRSTLMLVSPYEAQQWMGTPGGTEMGYLPDVHAMNFAEGVPKQNTPIQALFQVGQFSFPGGGQPTVSQSGQTAAMMILNGVNMPKEH